MGAVAMASRRALGYLLILLFHRRRELSVERQVEEHVQKLANGLGIRSAVAVKVGPGLSSPIALGILRPTIALPAGFTREYDPAHQEVILAHELAHLAGRDPVWLLLADLVTACFWWHPLVWRARERLLKACELVADEASVLLENGPLTLATCLVALGRKKLAWTRVAPGIRGSGFDSALGRRVERLISLNGGSWRTPGGFRSWIARVLGSSLVVSLSVFPLAWARPRDSGGPEEGGKEMVAMVQTFKRSLAGMALVTVLGAGSDRSFPQDPQEAPEEAAPARDGSTGVDELYDEGSGKLRTRQGSGTKRRGVTIEDQIMTRLQALSKRLEAIEKELGGRRGSSGSESDLSKGMLESKKAYEEFLKAMHQNIFTQQNKSADSLATLVANALTSESGTPAVKWEYKVVSTVDTTNELKGLEIKRAPEGEDLGKAIKQQVNNLEKTLNELGAQGWELCAETQYLYVFKRQVASQGLRK